MNGSAIRGRSRACGRRRPGFSVETDTRTTSKPEAALQERTEARALRCFGHRKSSRPSALLQGSRACGRSARPVLDRGHAAQSLRQPAQQQNGRATCRERVCQYVEITVVGGYLKKQKKTKY